MSDVAGMAQTVSYGIGNVGRLVGPVLGLLAIGGVFTAMKLADKGIGEALGMDGPVTQAAATPAAPAFKPAMAM